MVRDHPTSSSDGPVRASVSETSLFGLNSGERGWKRVSTTGSESRTMFCEAREEVDHEGERKGAASSRTMSQRGRWAINAAL
jgi:hypothetical protein